MTVMSSSPAHHLRDQNRRRFLRSTSLGALATAALGLPIPFARHLPPGIIPLAWAEEDSTGLIEGKQGLRMLSDRPVNAETPVTLLDDEFTPNRRHFIRNNGLAPERAETRNLSDWKLTIDGEVDRPLQLTLAQLQSGFPQHRAALVLECAGNGRAGFHPPAKGNQWTLGAVGCAWYKGVRLRDVLRQAGLKSQAVYVAYYGADAHLSRDPNRVPISRGVPLAKAMDANTLLTWEMNDVPLPPQHGFPLRLICPGWPGSTSGKWLRRLWIRNQVHDGPKMTGFSYRIPNRPVAPGTELRADEMVIIQEMPIKSIITHPGTGVQIAANKPLLVRGQAWCGSGQVAGVHLSLDFGATWLQTHLRQPVNPFAWQRWETEIKLPQTGYFEVWARATDQNGRMQPMVVPGWNPRGYLNNAMQRIAVKAV